MRYTLRDEGFPYLKIYQGRNWVGRVFKHADGHWVGMIGKQSNRIECTAPTKEDAFRKVAARALGFASEGALHAHNAAVRRKNLHAREVGRYAASEMLRGNFEPFHNLLTKGKL